MIGSCQKLLRNQGNAALILTVKVSDQVRLTLLKEDPERFAKHGARDDA